MIGRIGALLLAAGLVSLAACGSSAAHAVSSAHSPSAHPAVPQCKPASARMIKADGQVSVYALHGLVYACERRSGKRVQLGQATTCIGTSRVDRVAVAGDVVAYGLESCGVDTGSASVLVRKLSTGAQLRGYAAVSGNLKPESYQSVDSLIVRRDGDVAWIVAVTSIVQGGQAVEVHRGGTLLDSGSAIRPGSLRLHGSQLSWDHGTTVRTASVP